MRRNCSRPERARTARCRMIDIVTARLDAKSDSYLATLPSLRLNDVRIGDKLVSDHERMLTGGFYAEVDLGYDAGHRPGEGRPALRDSDAARNPALDARHSGYDCCGRGRRFPRMNGRISCSQCRAGAIHTESTRARRVAAAHGSVRGAQLQHGGTWPSRHRQEPPVPAGFALCPSGLRRQGDRRADVCQQGQRPARVGLPVRCGVLRRGVRRLLRLRRTA